MRPHRQSRPPAGPRRLVVRLVLAALAAVLALIAQPGPASAAGTVTPLFDCFVDGSGTTKLVLGYANTTGKSVTYASGSASNTIKPTKYNGAQVTTFKSGTFHGAFAVTVSDVDLASVSWTLGSTTISYADFSAAANECAPGTTMPASGNGTGPAVVLLVAGLVGALVVRRVIRRSTAPA